MFCSSHRALVALVLSSKRQRDTRHKFLDLLKGLSAIFPFCVSSESRFQRLSSSSSGQQDFESELVGI